MSLVVDKVALTDGRKFLIIRFWIRSVLNPIHAIIKTEIMTFEEYQIESKKTAVYPKKDGSLNYPLTYPVMGMLSEAGEVAGKVKKAIRDNGGVIDEERKQDLAAEVGDVLWYMTQICSELGLSLDEIAKANLDKLNSRMDRGVLSGNGDNR